MKQKERKLVLRNKWVDKDWYRILNKPSLRVAIHNIFETKKSAESYLDDPVQVDITVRRSDAK